jgi:adenylyl-sulfate kinase
VTTTDQGFTIWLTGLSGAGKSTVAELLLAQLREAGRKVELLDGDVVRTHLSSGLGFSREDRDTNVRRVGWLCEMLNKHGVDTIAALISPYRATRDEVRAQVPNFFEVHMDCPLEVLAARDVKGLYRRAFAGEIQHFTGVSDPYEPPLNPEVVGHSDREPPETSADRVLATLREKGLLP